MSVIVLVITIAALFGAVVCITQEVIEFIKALYFKHKEKKDDKAKG